MISGHHFSDVDSPAMAETEDKGAEPPQQESQGSPKHDRWYQRSTIRTLRRQAETEHRYLRNWDKRENDETRLPASEALHLGGLVLTESFTPSTVSSLYKALERWSTDHGDRKQEAVEQLARSRSGERSGWQNLGVARRPGAFMLGGAHADPDLPPGVDAVWVHVSYVTPALAMVVATFTLTEEAGDLSPLLRQDYQSQVFDVRIRVRGRFGDIRARVPWSRPATDAYSIGYSMSNPGDQKQKACDALIREHEEACSNWFVAKFPGRFAAARPERRPVIRMLFTQEQVPYRERRLWLRPAGLDVALRVWRSTNPTGWWLSEDRWPPRDGRYIMTLAARRADAAREPTEGESGESNWYLTQQFGSDQAPLAARYAMTALLSLYGQRLGDLRDKAGVKRFPRRVVHEARELDDYLIRDGLDAATVTSDLETFTRDLNIFRWGVPEFTEDQETLPEAMRGEPADYVPSLCAEIRETAARLASDTKTTTGNIRASAELRQAITSTTLQRFIVALSMVATIIAVVSLLR
jgi:hypothetical protein